ncbi:MAG: S-adenosylmethionine:tRNA ribosyltransferase-isomerase [Polyangiaceae bacterium]|nr:S-adenosylmethionine:tRNA ribosyltransferase-isomerase [Polyangiaceae bacterium]
MTPARWPRPSAEAEQLMVVDATSGAVQVTTLASLADILSPGDLFVVNDAATLPGLLPAKTVDGRAIELRIARIDFPRIRAIALGDGPTFAPTESRGAPPDLGRGGILEIAGGVRAEVVGSAHGGRLLDLDVRGDAAGFWRAVYAYGRPIQYSYVERPLSLYHVQTAFASRPWAAEMPSAGRPITWRALGALRKKGVGIARVTHGAGLSSTGSDALDACLPFVEKYEIGTEAAKAIADTRRLGGRIVAAGTTVVRALESAVRAGDGEVLAGRGDAALVLDDKTPRLVVDVVLTGIHEAGTSHHRLLSAFAPSSALDGALAAAEAHGFLLHEFGDSMLVVASPRVPLRDVTARERSATIAA